MVLSRFKRKSYSIVALFLLIVGLPTLAFAGAKIKIDDTKYFQIGMGFRGSMSLNEDNAPSGNDASFDLAADNMRLYTVSQVHKNIQVEFNTEINQVDDWEGTPSTEADYMGVVLLDAVAKINFGAFDFWLGRQLPPSDRSNLDGPYYLNAAYSYPTIASAYPGIFAGRDNGAAVHGDINGGEFKWAYGVFEGRTGATSSDQEDRVLHAARIDFALSDPEPGFYTGSTYFGAKKLTTFGFVFQTEKDGVGTSTNQGDFTGWNVDALIERTLGNGAVVDLEGAYYDYHTDGKTDTIVSGQSFLFLASYLMPNKTSIGGIQGKLQPYFRLQGFNRDMSNTTGNTGYRSRTEAGINYVIDGFNAKITGLWYQDAGANDSTRNTLMLAMQFQL